MDGTGLARRAEWATAASVSSGVSTSEESGVVGRVEAVDRDGRVMFRSEGGRRRDVRDGEGGKGVGGRL